MSEPLPASKTFPRSRRVKFARDFERARKLGRRVVSGSLIANWLPLEAGAPLRLGVVTGRKVGGAVERNRARRLMREVFRIHQGEFNRPVDLILIARPSMAGKSFQDVEKDFLRALRQGGLLSTRK
jgi:ribonuclease P protein component